MTKDYETFDDARAGLESAGFTRVPIREVPKWADRPGTLAVIKMSDDGGAPYELLAVKFKRTPTPDNPGRWTITGAITGTPLTAKIAADGDEGQPFVWWHPRDAHIVAAADAPRDPFATSDEGSGALVADAIELHEIMSTFARNGFTAEQAFELAKVCYRENLRHQTMHCVTWGAAAHDEDED